MKRVETVAWCLVAWWLGGCGAGSAVKEDQPVQTAGTEVAKPKPPPVSEEGKLAFQAAVESYQAQKKSGMFDYEGLLAQFQAVADQDSKMAEPHYNMGCIHEAMRDDEKAEAAYKKALDVRPDLTLAAANWGALLARRGNLDQALLVYKKALSKDAKNSAVLLNMAAIYQQQKKLDEALAKASEVLVRDPANVGAYRVMASVYYDKGDMDMAHLICARGLVVREKDPRLLNTLGLVLLKLERVPEALAQFRMALDQEPDMIPTRFNIAKIALDYKDFRIAKGEFAKILEYEPTNRQASIGLGISLRGAGEFDAARAHFEALAGKDPKDPVPRFWLGVLALRNFNDMKAATEQLKAFTKLSGSRISSDHVAYKYLDEIEKGVEMEKKVKDMEKKAEEEQKRQEEREKRLAEMRKKTVDKAWADAEANGDVLPPAKLAGDQLPFILIPLAVTPTQNTKVQLMGMVFKGVKTIEIGSLKAKFQQVDETTLEMIVPKGLGLGAWDVMITFKEKSEDPIIFQGGLWVGEKPKKKPEPAKTKDKNKAKDKDKAVEPGKEPPKEDKPAGEPPKAEGVKGSEQPGEGKPVEPKEPKEPKEPSEPVE